MTTVFTLPDAFVPLSSTNTLPFTLPFTLPEDFESSSTLSLQLGGTITNGNTVIPIDYPNFNLEDSSIDTGAQMLDDEITSTPGDKVVFGHGLGVIVIARWLHDYGPTSLVPPSELSFINIGNPVRKYGGFLNGETVHTLTDFSGNSWAGIIPVLTPEDTPYNVTDIARQYDGFADWPNIQSPAAVANAYTGMNTIHPFYLDTRLDDPNNISLQEANITYIWSPTRLLIPDYLIEEIETAYNRPVPIPIPHSLAPSRPPTHTPGTAKLADLNEKLMHGTLSQVVDAAEELANIKDDPDFEFIVTICDKLWRPIGETGDFIELSGTDPRNDCPTATLQLKGESEFIDAMMKCRAEMVGVKIETAGLKFAHYVDTHEYAWDHDAWIGKAELRGIWDILNYLQIWPTWYYPIQIQPISHAVFIGPLCTVIENMIAEQALRIQSGLNEFINNALSGNPDIRAWFGTLLQSNGNIFTMLKTPIYVVRTNPFLDTSPLYARTVRMESCGTVITEITSAYGIDVQVNLWEPGDEQPDFWTKNIPFMALDQPTYVVTVKDRSQITGPTKTVLDSTLRTVVDLQGSLLGNVLAPLLNPQGLYAPEGVFIAPILGLNFVEPYAILEAPEPGEKSSLLSCKIYDHTAKGWQLIIGGKSPKWLNDLINATLAYLLDAVMAFIGITGIPSDLLAGFLNDAFLAFQLIGHYQRRSEMGPYHPAIERFQATGSAPYNIEALFSFINLMWDSRGYTSAIATFRNGEKYSLGKDIFRGGLVSLVYHGRKKMYTDYIELVMYRMTQSEREVLIQIGDGKADESPLAKHQRYITALQEAFNVLTLAPSS